MLDAALLDDDHAWLQGVSADGSWPALDHANDARRRRILASMRLEELLPLVERAADRRAAAAGYSAWIAENPAAPQLFAAWFNLGVELAQAGDRATAVIAYRNALALKPDLHQAAVNLGLALEGLGQPQAALEVWQGALQPDSARVALLNHRGRLLESNGDLPNAVEALRASLIVDPHQPDVLQHWTHLRQRLCAWPILQTDIPGLGADEMALNTGPLGALALFDDVAQQRRIAELWLARKVPAAPARLSPLQGYRHDRIRLGYLSSDFCRHAMSFLIAEVLERHDRAQFEVFGYCSSIEDGSDIRRRVIAALDHHVPIGGMTDEDAAYAIRADEIDILIDLNGLTRGARLGTIRAKPAPVQATYLGYIGSVPLPELDWLICDAQAVPPDQAPHYAPRPLVLPGLYQANDSRELTLPAVSRAAEGLPAEAFVFCCFSHYYKITEAMFDAWMQILRAAPIAVLWLVEDNATGRRNLERRALDRGIDPARRIIFAARVDPDRYRARLALADLFLDTSPYNAGTVASDALRMGLPLLTLSGRAFASRMAGSLLCAVGLNDCITDTADAYVARAVTLATDTDAYAGLRKRLAGDAWARSLGDTAGFTRRLEDALRRIRLTPP